MRWGRSLRAGGRDGPSTDEHKEVYSVFTLAGLVLGLQTVLWTQSLLYRPLVISGDFKGQNGKYSFHALFKIALN